MVHKGAEPVQLRGVELAEPDCVAEDFDGEVVVLNSATGVYFSLTGLAAGVWRDLMAGQSLDALLDAIRSIDTQVHQATMDFIHRLQAAGLVRPRSATAPSASSAESARGLTSCRHWLPASPDSRQGAHSRAAPLTPLESPCWGGSSRVRMVSENT